MTTQATNPFNDYVFINASPSDRGSFTLATEKALAKLEKFQLPDPTFFILQWIQALVASGAGKIHIQYSTSSLRGEFELSLTFDGPGYTRTEIDTLYDHVFKSGRDRSVDRLRELALGWLSACSLSTSLLKLESNGRRRIRVKKGATVDEKTETPAGGEEDQQAAERDILHRLTVHGKGHHPFEEIVRRRCGDVSADLVFNGNSVTGSSGPGGVPWPNRPFRNGATEGVMGATYGGSAASNISFLRYGVEFVRRSEPGLLPPAILRVSDPTLSKNVSQTDVVRDEAYEEFLARVRSEMKTMGLELTKKRIPAYQREALNKFIQAYLVSYIDIRVFNNPDRLAQMGEEFANLIRFPLFRVAGNAYVSLAGLREEYQRKGYLLYSLDQRSQMARWDGTLLCLEPEEVGVLQTFFSNLIPLSFGEVKLLCQGGLQQRLASARRRPVIASITHHISEAQKKSVNLALPDVYPTGHCVLCRKGTEVGETIPGLPLTLLVEWQPDQKLNSNDLAHLRHTLHQPVRRLLKQLAVKLTQEDISKNKSRMRYAELACEQILYLFQLQEDQSRPLEVLKNFGEVVCGAPILGLEDGNLVSLNDLFIYLVHAGSVYMGGAFVEGLESGSLDPMPRAEELLKTVLQPSQIVSIESVKDRLEQDPQIKLDIRRQTLMTGLAKNPDPAACLRNFANEAAAQAALVAKMEKEYREALKGPKLFVKPDEERLKELKEQTEPGDDFVPFHLEGGAGGSSTPPPDSPPQPEVGAGEKKPNLPSLEHDLDDLRRRLGDFCSSPGAIHVERREEEFTLHLSVRWQQPGADAVHILEGNNRRSLSHPLPVEGFIRLTPECPISATELLTEALEQLVLKVLHSYRSEPTQSRHRHRVREWLLECCRHFQEWKKLSPRVVRELLALPLVPCLGGRILSWEQLRSQARRLGYTAVSNPAIRDPRPNPKYEVICLQAEWRDDLLKNLGFPRLALVGDEEEELDFDILLLNAFREIRTVLSGAEADLIRSDVIGKLAEESSFWTRWRSGFLSWDADLQRALVNPEHKIGKKLLKNYKSEQGWSAVLACALFSTINRGLNEVEDHHEHLFLRGLLDTLE